MPKRKVTYPKHIIYALEYFRQQSLVTIMEC